MGRRCIVDMSSANGAKRTKFKTRRSQLFFQRIPQFWKHDVIYDNMETLLQLNYNFEEQWGQLVDLIGYIQYHSEL